MLDCSPASGTRKAKKLPARGGPVNQTLSGVCTFSQDRTHHLFLSKTHPHPVHQPPPPCLPGHHNFQQKVVVTRKFSAGPWPGSSKLSMTTCLWGVSGLSTGMCSHLKLSMCGINAKWRPPSEASVTIHGPSGSGPPFPPSQKHLGRMDGQGKAKVMVKEHHIFDFAKRSGLQWNLLYWHGHCS